MYEYKSFPFELKASEGDGSTFSGLASVYNVLDSYNEIVAPGAFSKSLPEFLAKGSIRFLHGVPIGKPTAAAEGTKALAISGTISDTVIGRDAKTLIKDKVIQSLSIGFRTVSSAYLNNEADVQAYWAKEGYLPSEDEASRARYGARVLTEVKLFEVSLVDIPANGACDITAVKSALNGGLTVADVLAFGRAELKAGRVLSGANRKRLEVHAGALEQCAEDLRTMLHETDPKGDVAEGSDDDESDSKKKKSAGDVAGGQVVEAAALLAELDLMEAMML